MCRRVYIKYGIYNEMEKFLITVTYPPPHRSTLYRARGSFMLSYLTKLTYLT